MRTLLRLSKIALATVIGFYIVVCVAMALFQRRFIYFPTHDVPPPAAAGAPEAEEVSFAAADGTPLHGWFHPARPKHGAANGYAILKFHGNAGNLADRAEKVRELAQAGFAVFIFDYRGYGKSGGTPTEAGIYEDARAALAALLARPGVDPKKIVYLGTSLGSGPATQLATETPPAALVLETPFSSIADVARGAYPFLPVGLLVRDRFDNASKIGAVHVPVVVLHGDADSMISCELGKRLFAAANEPKRLVIIRGADHNDCWALGRMKFLEALRGALGIGEGHAP